MGIAVHCAKGSAFCAGATGVKFGQTTPTSTAVTDRCRTSPAATPATRRCSATGTWRRSLARARRTLTEDGYQVTNAAGNLVDLNGNQINGDFLTTPGFPGFGEINASQSLAYAADMLGSGVPVVNMYISDIHGDEFIKGLSSAGEPCFHAPAALGSGSACYLAQAAYYNQAFGTFFQRLAAEGITPRTRCSCSARTRVTTRRAPTSAARSSRPRRTVTALPCRAPTRRAPSASSGQRHRPAERGEGRHHPVRHGVRHGARVSTSTATRPRVLTAE